MTCQTCISWKRQGEVSKGSSIIYGYCFNSDAIEAYFSGTDGQVQDRMPVHAGYDRCDLHAPKAIFADALEERAAIMEYDGCLPPDLAEQMAAEDVRKAMFREGKAR